MTFNEFKLYCILFVKKYEGKTYGEILENCSVIIRHEVISTVTTHFDIEEDCKIFYFCTYNGFTVFRYTKTIMYLQAKPTGMSKHKQESFEDIVWLLKDIILY